MAWTPGRRKAARELEDPYFDVPEHLQAPLWRWISGELTDGSLLDPGRIFALAIAMREDSPDAASTFARWNVRSRNDAVYMLDLVEAILSITEMEVDWESLDALLEEANSAYVTNEDGDGLAERVAHGVKEVVTEAIAASHNSAGAHLTAAWNAAYGRTPDPVRAYSEAVKAAESALAQRVTPQNAKQTLGTMIADINNAPQNWQLVLSSPSGDGVPVVVGMMRSLWTNQTSRHGGVAPTRPETKEEARAAVQLAAALVQFGASGAFARK